MKLLLMVTALAVAMASPTFAQNGAPTSAVANASSPAVLKRKVAIGRFSNATRYGKALLIDGERDPLADQAADMLTARLVDSGKFIVFDRGDLGSLEREQEAAGVSTKLVGVDAVIVGSVTEFGRKVEGKSGFLNSKMRQIATATVEVRVVDVQTGRAFFSTRGSGTASVEVGEVAGFGSKAGYDSTLNDKAISSAISDLITNLLQRLQERRWSSDVLQVRGTQVFISGGPSQGLKAGDRLRLETRGETITSGQSGLPIRLPGQAVATLEIMSFFGEDPASEGAIARVVQGAIQADPKTLIVVEDR
jgi:curli biogenesis system outer membrane secretion channel CsgG